MNNYFLIEKFNSSW